MSHINNMFSGVYYSDSDESDYDYNQPAATPQKPSSPAGDLKDRTLISRVSECFGVSQKRASKILSALRSERLLDSDESDMQPSARNAAQPGGEYLSANKKAMDSSDHSTSMPAIASSATDNLSMALTADELKKKNRLSRSLHDSVLMSADFLRKQDANLVPGVDATTSMCIYDLIQLIRKPSGGSQRERSHILELIDFLANETWPVAAWCDTVYYADKTGRGRIRKAISEMRVKFVASSAAESGVLGNTEQLYMVKRIPRDMIQNTGLRKDPLVKAPSNHGKVRNGAIVRLSAVANAPSSTSVDPVVWDGNVPFIYIQMLNEPHVQGFLRLTYLHPYRLVNVQDCPDGLNGKLRYGMLRQTIFYKLERGVLTGYSDAGFTKPKQNHNLANLFVVYQAEKDKTVIHLKFKKKPRTKVTIRKQKSRSSSAISIGESFTLKASNVESANLWVTSISLHSAWINWQSQSDDRNKKRLIKNFVSVGSLSSSSGDLRRPVAALKWTYDKSLFKQCYEAASAPNTVLDVLQPLNAMIVLFAEMCGIPDHRTVAEAFYRRLEYEIFEVREAHKQVNNVCQRLWTSTLHLFPDDKGNDDPDYQISTVTTATTPSITSISTTTTSSVPADLNLELCSIINRSLQKDGALSPSVSLDQRRRLLEHVAVICRGINTIRAVGSDDVNELVRAGSMYIRSSDETPFPEGGVTWRGGGFRPEFKEFFVKGVKFRAPCYLATSFRKEIAEEFRRNAAARGYETIMWRIEVDPEGVTNPNRRCFQANYVRKTVLGLPDEQEFLFSQFAPFQVKEVNWSDNPRVKPHEVTLYALQDGRKESEDLPLSPWN